MDHKEVIETYALEGYLLDELNEDEKQSFEEHMCGCAACVEDLVFFDKLRESLRGNPSFDSRFRTPHTPHAIVAFVFDDLSAADKKSFEEHLRNCQACARQLRLGEKLFQTFRDTLAGTAEPGARLIAAFRLFSWLELAFAA